MDSTFKFNHDGLVLNIGIIPFKIYGEMTMSGDIKKHSITYTP